MQVAVYFLWVVRVRSTWDTAGEEIWRKMCWRVEPVSRQAFLNLKVMWIMKNVEKKSHLYFLKTFISTICDVILSDFLLLVLAIGNKVYAFYFSGE